MRQTQVIAAKCVKTESYFYFVKSHGKSHHKNYLSLCVWYVREWVI